MNEHLLPVFNIIFPRLRQSNIKFWVFGGVAIAGIKEEFLRKNDDLDIFVLENDFKKARIILERLCHEHSNWKVKHYPLLNGKRPKSEILIDEKEIFSLIPVYQTENEVEFLFPNVGSIIFSPDVLTSIRRKLNGYEFITPPDKFIKKLFENHHQLLLNNNHKGKHMKNYKIDKKYLDSLNIET